MNILRIGHPWLGLTIVFLASCVFVSKDALCDAMLGDVKAAVATSEGADGNPANAAVLNRSEFSAHSAIFQSSSLQIRYPGLEKIEQKDSGLSLPTSIPTFIYKVSPGFGIGGLVAPPLPIKVPIEKKKIPVVVLGTLNYVDVKAEGQLDGLANIIMGFRLSSKFALGFKVNFLAISATASLFPSEGGPALADLTIKKSDLGVNAGIRYDVVPGRFAIGFASDVLAMNSQDILIESPLLPPQSQPQNSFSVLNPADSFLIGFGARLSNAFKAYADFQYRRAPQGAKTFSLVGLKEKPIDVHDTLAVRTGVMTRLDGGKELMAGFRYEPASLGPGSNGEEELAGFNSLNVVEIFALGGAVKPFWQVGGGMRAHFGRKKVGRGKKARGYHEWTLGGGIAYKRASLGIDENGEQPGAYLQTALSIPIEITWRF